MSIDEAEVFIDSVPDLSEEHKVHLKTLLDRSVVFPNTILGRTLESLRGVVSRNPLPVSGTIKSEAKLSVIELVAKACQLEVSAVNSNAVQRMIRKFGFSVDIAIRTDDSALLASVYDDALKLPSVQTTLEMERNGFVLDGILIDGNDSLQICFKKSVPHVLKICTPQEYERAKNFEDVFKAEPCEWIISYELYTRHLKFYMFMPLHPITLEHLPSLDSSTAPLFWHCISTALKYLHKNGYAHNDVKPPNILINTSGEFLLTDLGSLVLFNNRSASTKAYIPRELWDRKNDRGPLASLKADYWMLAMTIFEKACGGNIVGAEAPKQSTIKNAIETCPKCSDFSAELLDFLA